MVEAEEETAEDPAPAGVPDSIKVSDSLYYRDPYAEVHSGEIFVRDSSAFKGSDGQVYVWNPYAF